MRNYITVGLMLLSGLLFGQADKLFISAIEKSDFELAQSYLAERLDFCINDDQEYLKKAESVIRLKRLIAEQGVASWEVVHKGASKDGSSTYSILKAKNTEKPLRLLVYSEEDGDNTKVSEIRLEY